MLALMLTLLVVAIALLALFWTGTTLAQTYIYDSPVDRLSWRAPAAAGLVTLFLAFWTFLDYSYPRGTDTMFSYSNEVRTDVKKFWSVRKNERGEEEVPFEARSTGTGQVEFRDPDGRPWSRSASGMAVALIVEEKKGEETVRTRFNAEMKDGKFAPRNPRGVEQSLRYLEENGSRSISEDQLGKIVSYRRGRLFWVVLLNLAHLGVWFAALWPLLRFQWPHALGFAVVLWLVMTLAVVPYLLDAARSAAAKKAASRPAATALLRFSQPDA